jgi:hypothetical protein
MQTNLPSFPVRKFLLALAIVAGLAAAPVRALVIVTDPAQSHTEDPDAGWGWDHVGIVNGGASGVYLGNLAGGDWVLTATHVGGGRDFTLNGVTYAAVAGSNMTLRNGNGSSSDLMLFRLATSPNLAPLALATVGPAVGSSLIFAGYGFTATGSETHWQVSSGTWTETSDPLLADRSGYRVGSQLGTLTWGRATVSGYLSYNVGTGTTKGFYTTFEDRPGYAQGAGGDSGSPVFVQTDTGWKLAGIASAVSGLAGQPAGTAVYGDLTIVGSLGSYNGPLTQILGDLSPISAPIPEPGTWAAWAGGCSLLLAWIRRRRPATSH